MGFFIVVYSFGAHFKRVFLRTDLSPEGVRKLLFIVFLVHQTNSGLFIEKENSPGSHRIGLLHERQNFDDALAAGGHTGVTIPNGEMLCDR